MPSLCISTRKRNCSSCYAKLKISTCGATLSRVIIAHSANYYLFSFEFFRALSTFPYAILQLNSQSPTYWLNMQIIACQHPLQLPTEKTTTTTIINSAKKYDCFTVCGNDSCNQRMVFIGFPVWRIELFDYS